MGKRWGGLMREAWLGGVAEAFNVDSLAGGGAGGASGGRYQAAADSDHDDMMDDALLNPDEEHATELGEVPHEEEKGSILQKNLFAPYLYGRYTW